MTDIIFIWPPLRARILVFKPRLCSNNYGVDTTCQTCHTRLPCTGGLLCLQHTDTTCVIIYYQIYFKHIWLSNKVLKVRMFSVPSPGLAQWLTQSDHGTMAHPHLSLGFTISGADGDVTYITITGSLLFPVISARCGCHNISVILYLCHANVIGQELLIYVCTYVIFQLSSILSST